MHRILAGSLAALALPATAFGQQAMSPPGWTSAGNGAANTRAARNETILNSTNVGSLVPVWALKTGGDVPDTPTLDGSNLYFVDGGGFVWRVDASTGTPSWKIALKSITGNTDSTARSSPAIGPDTVIIGDQASATVYALNKKDGSLAWSTKLDKSPGAIITSSPLVIGSLVITGVASNQEELAAVHKGFVPNFRGSVAALDLQTGAVKWQFYTVPAGFTGGAVWGSNLAADAKRGAVYFGTGDNYTVPPSVAACQVAAQNGKQQEACLPKTDQIDSVTALNMNTGTLIWTNRLTTLDTWTVSCLPQPKAPKTPCPQPAGLDYDFGSAPNLFSTNGSGTAEDLVGAGQKSGVYWAFDRDTGKLVWATQVNPGGTRGGIEWGAAVDGKRVYVAASNANYVWTKLAGQQTLTDGGFWSALDINNGQVLWQTPTTDLQKPPSNKSSRTIKIPKGATARTEGAVSVANGVMYGADASGQFVALEASTGKQLWSYDSGGAAVDGPSIVNGQLFWGDGYGDIGPSNPMLYAFGLPK